MHFLSEELLTGTRTWCLLWRWWSTCQSPMSTVWPCHAISVSKDM